jgi:hypothetical protein
MLDGYQKWKQEYGSKQDWRGRFTPECAGALAVCVLWRLCEAPLG